MVVARSVPRLRARRPRKSPYGTTRIQNAAAIGIASNPDSPKRYASKARTPPPTNPMSAAPWAYRRAGFNTRLKDENAEIAVNTAHVLRLRPGGTERKSARGNTITANTENITAMRVRRLPAANPSRKLVSLVLTAMFLTESFRPHTDTTSSVCCRKPSAGFLLSEEGNLNTYHDGATTVRIPPTRYPYA